MEEKQTRSLSRLKTMWYGLQFPLLIIILIVGFVWLGLRQGQAAQQESQAQRITALQIAHDQQQETLLTNYMNTISDLLVHDKLLTTHQGDPAMSVANAQTQEVLKKLDADHKAALMSFLYETLLINNDHHIIDMSEADLQKTHLNTIDLRDTYLVGANLAGANLQGATLTDATLSYVNFSGADLSGANLSSCDLHNVDLTGANLAGANLKDAFDLGTTAFAKAKSLAGATMPDGTVHP